MTAARERSSATRLGAAMDLRFDETVSEFVDFLADYGLNHVELKREYLHAHPRSPTPQELAEIRREYDISLTFHAPFRDWNLGSFNDASRRASVEQVKQTLNDAAAAGAGAVVVHGGSVPHRYPDRVHEKAYRHAVRSMAQCAEYAHHIGVPLCLENQPRSDSDRRHTTTPDRLETFLSDIEAECDPVAEEWLGLTLDIGHAKVNGIDWRGFASRFGERINVVHLSDNDGESDDHEPIFSYEQIIETTTAEYYVFEMKEVADIEACIFRQWYD